MAIKHKCFVSYHQIDEKEVKDFISEFDDVFLARAVGVTVEDDFIDSDDTKYVLRRIRELYLTDSTVTIVMIGRCTWARKFVDWEVASTLRNDPNNKRSGLLAIELKSRASRSTRLPARVNDNVLRTKAGKDFGYARWIKYPASKSGLRAAIQGAFDRRSTQDPVNSRSLRQRNSPC